MQDAADAGSAVYPQTEAELWHLPLLAPHSVDIHTCAYTMPTYSYENRTIKRMH